MSADSKTTPTRLSPQHSAPRTVFLVCGCGNWMHTAGVDERWGERGDYEWVVRMECRRCRLHVGAVGTPREAGALVDRLMWTDEARHALDRLAPHVQVLVKQEAEAFARGLDERVLTFSLLAQARNGGAVAWDPDAEGRLERVPAAVRAMARQELERTALEKGESRVTVRMMEEVKGRYFGMFASRS